MAANTIRVRFITSMISYSARTARAIQLELSGKQNESLSLHYTFTSPHGRARIAKISLIVGAIAAGMSGLAESLSFGFPPLTEDQEFGENPGAGVVALITGFRDPRISMLTSRR